MPIHDVGYRPWEGERTSQFSRWSIISSTGIRLGAKSRWVKRILFVAWLPVMYWGVGFFFIEKAIDSELLHGDPMATLESMEPGGQAARSERSAEMRVEPGVSDDDGRDDPVVDDELREKAIEAAAALLGLEKDAIGKREIEALIREIMEEAKAIKDEGLAEADEQVRNRLSEIEAFRKDLEVIAVQFVEKTKDQKSQALLVKSLKDQFSGFPFASELADSLESGDTERIRNDVWRWLLMVFFRYPQSLLILFLIGTIAPSLISRDLRSRAFLLYFSRPIGKLEYIFGKLCIPAAFIIAITTLPALALYCFAVLMSPSVTVIFSTWDIPLRIIGATVVLVVPTASIALMLSSLTHESRFASFSWFAVWMLGHGAWFAIYIATGIQMASQQDNFQMVEAMNSELVRNWAPISLYNCLGDAQALIFGFASLEDAWRGTLVLFIATVFSLFILYRRVSAPIRV